MYHLVQLKLPHKVRVFRRNQSEKIKQIDKICCCVLLTSILFKKIVFLSVWTMLTIEYFGSNYHEKDSIKRKSFTFKKYFSWLTEWICQKNTTLLLFYNWLNNNNYNNNNNNDSNHNYIKILEFDWSLATLIWALIVQLYASCLCNWTVRVIKRALIALEWVISFSI